MTCATSLSRSIGAMEGIHVHATLSTLGRIAGVPPSELADRIVSLEDSADGALRSLGSWLQDAPDRETQSSVLDGLIADRLAASTPEEPVTAYLLARLSAGCGSKRWPWGSAGAGGGSPAIFVTGSG